MPKRRRKKKRIRKQLPKRIIPMVNQDKGFHEKWYPGRDELNIPHPFRCLLLGPPNSGKTMIIKNLVARMDPEFERILIVHCTPDFTDEYNDMGGAQITDQIPGRDEFDRDQKTLVILEDLEFKHMGKEQKARLSRLYGNWSTHGNISICSTSQDFFQIIPLVKRCTNLFIVWPMIDESVQSMIARQMGLSLIGLRRLFALCTEPHDSVWIDKTVDSPFPIRISGYRIINDITRKGESREIS